MVITTTLSSFTRIFQIWMTNNTRMQNDSTLRMNPWYNFRSWSCRNVWSKITTTGWSNHRYWVWRRCLGNSMTILSNCRSRICWVTSLWRIPSHQPASSITTAMAWAESWSVCPSSIEPPPLKEFSTTKLAHTSSGNIMIGCRNGIKIEKSTLYLPISPQRRGLLLWTSSYRMSLVTSKHRLNLVSHHSCTEQPYSTIAAI